MKNKWKPALILILVVGATLTVFEFGVQTAVDSSLKETTQTEAHPSSQLGQPSQSKETLLGAAQNKPTENTSSAAPVAKSAVTADHNCFAFEYRHTKEAQNKDIEDFLDYSNAFPVLHANLNPKSVCVKVNQKPVAFKLIKYKSQDEVMIGSVVGPESVIRVSYCVGKVTCKEACTVKSNRFMDDMMSDAGDEDEFKDSWGDATSAAHTAQKKELQGKVKELRSIASENKDLAQRSVIRTWDTLQKQEWVCKK
jgi:hypothetical protein